MTPKEFVDLVQWFNSAGFGLGCLLLEERLRDLRAVIELVLGRPVTIDEVRWFLGEVTHGSTKGR